METGLSKSNFADVMKEFFKKPLKYLVRKSSKRDFAEEYEIKKLTEDSLVIKLLRDPDNIRIGNTYTEEIKLVKVDSYVYLAAYLRAWLATSKRLVKEQKEKIQNGK